MNKLQRVSVCAHSRPYNIIPSQQTQNICIKFIQRRPNVFDVGPTLYKCYTNVSCLLVCNNNAIHKKSCDFHIMQVINYSRLLSPGSTMLCYYCSVMWSTTSPDVSGSCASRQRYASNHKECTLGCILIHFNGTWAGQSK